MKGHGGELGTQTSPFKCDEEHMALSDRDGECDNEMAVVKECMRGRFSVCGFTVNSDRRIHGSINDDSGNGCIHGDNECPQTLQKHMNV